MGLIECIPNFSTSDDKVISEIVEPIKLSDTSKLLNIEAESNYNRVVVTFSTTDIEVVNICYDIISIATKLIDMTKHQGMHPRIGATDVFPLVPLKNSSFEECINFAQEIAEKVGSQLKIPVYLYGKAANKNDRRMLSNIRRGEYEGLQEKLKDEKWKPDYGPAKFVPKTGACVIGVRDFLIAYNVNLTSKDIEIAKTISRKIRTSGWYKTKNNKRIREPGYLNGIQAMGVKITRGSRELTQVSTNVLDYTKKDSIHDVYEAVKKEAKNMRTKITGSEIVGLIPKECLVLAGRYYAKKQLPDRDLINIAIRELRLSDLEKFDPEKKIIENLLQ